MSYTDAKAVQKRVQEHYDETVALGYDVIGVFLQGSWNYGLGWEGSDVDTKAIVVPSFEDLALGRKPISKTHVLENGEHIDLKDVRLMIDCYKKQNINFVETLFTPWRLISQKYIQEFFPLINEREAVAQYNSARLISCIKGNLKNEESRLFKETPGTEKNINLYGCDVKSLSHIVRYMDFYNSFFVEKKSYADSLVPERLEEILRFKKGEFYWAEAQVVFKELEEFYSKMEAKYKELPNEPSGYVDVLFNDVLLKIFKKMCKEYMIKEGLV